MKHYIKYIGLILIIIGSLMLINSYIFDWTDINAIQIIALTFIVAGIPAHIILNKRL